MLELGPYGSVRGARGNSRPYREPGPTTDMARVRKMEKLIFGSVSLAALIAGAVMAADMVTKRLIKCHPDAPILAPNHGTSILNFVCCNNQRELIRNAHQRCDLERSTSYGQVADKAVDRGAAKRYRSSLQYAAPRRATGFVHMLSRFAGTKAYVQARAEPDARMDRGRAWIAARPDR